MYSCTQQNSYSISHYAALWTHSDWTVTMQPPLLTTSRTVTTLSLAAQSLCCWQLAPVTTLSISSHHVVSVPSRWLMEWEFCCVLFDLIMIRDLAGDPSARLFGRAIVIWDGQKNNHFGPFYTILGHFDYFRQFYTGTTVPKNGQFRNPS